MFLSKDSLGINIISSKSSEMNVLIPKDDEFVEIPVPEQFRTTVSGMKLETIPTEHNIDIIWTEQIEDWDYFFWLNYTNFMKYVNVSDVFKHLSLHFTVIIRIY